MVKLNIVERERKSKIRKILHRLELIEVWLDDLGEVELSDIAYQLYLDTRYLTFGDK